MSARGTEKRRVGTILFLIIGGILLTRPLLSYAGSNAGFLSINHSALLDTGLAASNVRDNFGLASELFPNNLASQRGKGYLNLLVDQFGAAQSQFMHGGFSEYDYLRMAEQAYSSGSPIQAGRWLTVAESANPSSTDLWQTAGRMCQRTLQLGSICDRFLDYNDQNWLVNSTFSFAEDGWNQRSVEGFDLHYGIEPCPDDVAGLCASMRLGSPVPEHGISWSQCLKLKPGQDYVFSSWIKVDALADSEWRPVYLQGSVDGEAKGMWPGTQKGSIPWTYWEQTFTMPAFDQDEACFYPTRLIGEGQVWFNRARLAQVER